MKKPKTVVPLPVAGKSKKEYEEVEMPLVADMLPPRMNELAGYVLSLSEQIKALEAQRDEHKAEAKALMEEVADAASWSARGDGWSVSYVKPEPRKTLVRELLIQQGVTLKQLEKATKETPSTPFVTFRLNKEKGGEGE